MFFLGLSKKDGQVHRLENLLKKLRRRGKAFSNDQFWASSVSFNKGNWQEAKRKQCTNAVSTYIWSEKDGAEHPRFS